MTSDTLRRHTQLAIWFVAFAACLIASLNMGVRATLGLFLTPMTTDLGINREMFALALAIQNLLWGVFTPILGAIADKYGSFRVIFIAACVYGLGLWFMAEGPGVWGLHIGGGVLLGIAMAGTGFGVVLGAVGRRVPVEKRSMALGIASAGGSFGQFYMAPVGQGLLQAHGWEGALVYLGMICLIMIPLGWMLSRQALVTQPSGAGDKADQTMGEALKEASRHQGFWLLTLGFFVCGYQVAFITVHFPAYLQDLDMPVTLAATALSLIGLFNVIGTYACGVMGGRFTKKWVLAWLYLLRSVVIVAMLLAPKTETNMLIFAAIMGLLWLGTVPLTSGLVAHMFGVRYLSTLFGITFFSHQVGSFLGVWLGGRLFDMTGSYDWVWYSSIALGVVAAALHLPIPEKSPKAAAAP